MEGSSFRGSSIPSTPSLSKKNVDRATSLVNDLKSDNDLEGLKEVLKQLEESNVNFTQKKKAFRAEVTKQLKETIREIEKENLEVATSPEEEQSESVKLSSSDLSLNNSQKKLDFSPRIEIGNHSHRKSSSVMTDRSTDFVNQNTTQDEKTPEKTESSPDIISANTNKMANIKLESSDNNSSGSFQTNKISTSVKKEVANKSSSSQEKSSPTEKDKAQVKKWIAEAKAKASAGELRRAKRLFEKAYSVIPSDRTKKRIEKLESLMSDDEESEEEEDSHVEGGEHGENLRLCSGLSKKLYAHQYKGVQWMYGLFRDGHKGGILADDMGLGKTIQVITFLASMMECEKIKHVLLVVPFSLVTNWVEEFKKWAPQISLLQFCGSTEAQQKRALSDAKRFRSVLITTYGLCQKRPTQLSSHYTSRQFVWDYTILDEGHRIKNPTKTTKSLHQIPSKNRIILTGTPVQNKLKDLWALLDWSTQGSLLGTLKSFQSSYERPIEASRQKGASHSDISHGLLVAQSLKKLTDPFVLRRTKSSLTNEITEEPAEGDRQHVAFPKLNKKHDIVCWTYLSDIQCKIYNDFLDMPEVKALLSSHRSPLVHLNILKKICDHPRLLSQRACINLGLMNKSMNEDGDLESSAANEIDNIPNEKLIAESGKLKFLIDLLMMLKSEGHRTAVFSSSRKVLNIIHKILNDRGFKVMRLDGRVTKMQERNHRVQKFQTDASYNVFLLTIQVGGVGLTLTGANRAVIFDPSWNPSTDNQAVDRIYRIGQEKKVIIYRLITCGSVEEKMYRRQVFKSSIIKQTIDKDEDPYRYFTSLDLTELFKLDDPTQSTTQMQLDELHSHQREWDDVTIKHIEKLNRLELFGISDNDLMFSKKPKDFERDSNVEEDLMNKVVMAQDTLRLESEKLAGGDAEGRWGGFKTESKEPTKPQNLDKNEPVYEIEGLHDTMVKKETWLLTEREQNFVETEIAKKEKEESILVESEEDEEKDKKIETIEIDSEEEEQKIESMVDEDEEGRMAASRYEQSKMEMEIVDVSDSFSKSKEQNESRFQNESKISEMSAVSKLSDKLEAELVQESHVGGNKSFSSRVVLAEDSMTSTTSKDASASFSFKDHSDWDTSFVRERKRVRNMLNDDDDEEEEPHSSSKMNLTQHSSNQLVDVSAREGDVTNKSKMSFDRSNSSFYSAKSSADLARSRRKMAHQLSKELINETILDGLEMDEDSQDLINSYLPLSSSEDEEELPSLMTRPSALNSFVSRRSIDDKLSSTPNAKDRTQHASYDFDEDINLISSEEEDAAAPSSSNNFSMHYENFKGDEADDDDEDEEELQKDISNILGMSTKYKEEDDIDDLDLS